MDELARLMEWDLQAIVGCSSTEGPAGAATMTMDNPHLSFSHFCPECSDDLLCNFHEFSETTTVVDELEELYKPFYPALSIVTSSQPVPEEVKPSDKVAIQDLQDIDPAASKCKRSKKSQKKKRVQHVTAANGVSDQWSWRKYGQKPIKGSPYPRSYYRCSSSKGCLARKQVERSHLDPAVFIVTYTAEHSHPHYPTRKNSQAKNRSTVAPPGTHDQLKLSPPGTPVMVEPNIADHDHAPSVELEQQSKGVKKEEGVVVEGDDGWFPSIEVEELNGLDQQLALDGYGFMDSTFAETCFGL